MPSFNTYDLYVTEQSLPATDGPWTEVEVNDKTYVFQRSTKNKPVFSISGYIQQESMEATEKYAHDLNSDLLTTPSGTFTDGYKRTYRVIVEEWEIRADPGRNRYLFSMRLRKMT